MNAKHTPGPWAIYGRAIYTADKRKHWIENRDRRAVYVAQVRARHDSEIGCHVDDVEDNPVCEQEAEANARLISAAPDLLEALERMLETAERLKEQVDYHEGFSGEYQSFKMARAALAKAKGQS